MRVSYLKYIFLKWSYTQCYCTLKNTILTRVTYIEVLHFCVVSLLNVRRYTACDDRDGRAEILFLSKILFSLYHTHDKRPTLPIIILPTRIGKLDTDVTRLSSGATMYDARARYVFGVAIHIFSLMR